MSVKPSVRSVRNHGEDAPADGAMLAGAAMLMLKAGRVTGPPTVTEADALAVFASPAASV